MRDISVLVFPDSLFRPQSAAPMIDRPMFKGPKPLSGREQIVVADGGGWAITYDGIAVYGANYAAWRKLWIKIVAKGLPIYVAPDLVSAVPSPALTLHSDGTAHSDGAKYAQRTSDCTLAAAGVKGARTISVTNSAARPREAGNYIELDGRVHVIDDIDGANWSIWPSLRADYASGTVIEIDDPRVLCVLTPDSRANAMNTDARQVTMMSLDFIEARW